MAKYLTRKPTQTLTDDQRNAARAIAVLNGVTFGLGDEIVAAIDYASGKSSYKDSFARNHDLLRQYRMENPGEDLAIEMISGIPTGGLLGKAFGALGPISKRGGGGIARRLNRTVMAGTAGGAFSGYAEGGAEEGDRVEGAKRGALFGAALGLLAPTAAAAVKGVPAPVYRALGNKIRGRPLTSAERAEAYVTEQMIRDNPKVIGKIQDALEEGDMEALAKTLGVPSTSVNSLFKGISSKKNPITAWDAMRSSAVNPGRARVSLADVFGSSVKEATRVVGLSGRGGGGRAARYFGERQRLAPKRVKMATEKQFLPRRAEKRSIESHIALSQKRAVRFFEKADPQEAGSRSLNSVVRNEKVAPVLKKHGIDYTGGQTTVGQLRQLRSQIDTVLEGVTDEAERAALLKARASVERELNRNAWYRKAVNANPGEDELRKAYQVGLDSDEPGLAAIGKAGNDAKRQAALIGVADKTKNLLKTVETTGGDAIKDVFGNNAKLLRGFRHVSKRPDDYGQFLRVVYNEDKLGRTFRGLYGDSQQVKEAVAKGDFKGLQTAARSAEPIHKKFYRWWQLYSRGLSPGVRNEMSKLLLPRSEHQMAQILGRTLLNASSVSRAERKLLLDLVLDLGIASSAGAASSREYTE